ncbi:MAG: TetR/AcrR family transcriptional regulator [Bacteroidetes bacterium]|nr:TetR/AcrR family transcriptional regulator [Bacteroidota bacterium]
MNDKVQGILIHVSRLYHRYGIKSVTMDDVARHLCISKKTLYEHFEDKKDLVKQVLGTEHNAHCLKLDEIMQRHLNAIEELFEIYKSLKNMIQDYNPSMDYDIRKYYPDLYLKVSEVKRETMFRNTLNNMIKGKKEGLYRKDLNSEVICRMHLFRIENMIDNEVFSAEELNSFTIFHELFVYHLYGIMSNKGRAFFEKNFDKFRETLNYSVS